MGDPVRLTVIQSRPRTRGECLPGGSNAVRPCQWSSCFYFLGHEKASCVLDVADQGGMTLEEVGSVFGLTRERIRQIESAALQKLSKRGLRIYLQE